MRRKHIERLVGGVKRCDILLFIELEAGDYEEQDGQETHHDTDEWNLRDTYFSYFSSVLGIIIQIEIP